MKLKCLHCGYEFDGSITKDELGWHSVCTECDGSFDVDVPNGQIIMAFALDETDEYFTDDWRDDNKIVTYYAFDTAEEFMMVWRKMAYCEDGCCPDSMWYWVLDNGNLICSGACDTYDEDIYKEYWGI